MLTRSLSNNIHNQVKSVVEDLINKAVTRRKKVTWASKGVTEARTFEIEPWRRIRPTPPTRVRSADKGTHDEPFTLPYAPMMKPLADYSDYAPKPTHPMPSWIVPSPPAECELVLIDDDDDDDKKPSSAAPLARTQPVSLAVIYAIAEELRKVKNMNEFIKESDKMELEQDLDDEFDVWAEDMYNE
jgi:hypothetical protein